MKKTKLKPGLSGLSLPLQEAAAKAIRSEELRKVLGWTHKEISNANSNPKALQTKQ